MKKLMIIVMAALPLLAIAQGKLDVKVDSVGKLATQLGDQKFKVSDLTVSGSLNGNDLKLLQEIVTRNKAKNPDECLVTAIDLSGITIVESKDKGGIKTQANELPKELFSDAKNLAKVVLPNMYETGGCHDTLIRHRHRCRSLPGLREPHHHHPACRLEETGQRGF